MPSLRDYHIFISHAWDYSEHYKTLKAWLDSAEFFRWSDYSIPVTNPIDASSTKELQMHISYKIALSSCLIIIAGMYADYSDWIDYEIDAAAFYMKPIIAVVPWGHERVPLKIQKNARAVVRWNSESVIDAVRDYAIPKS